jgi:hypothetical protein
MIGLREFITLLGGAAATWNGWPDARWHTRQWQRHACSNGVSQLSCISELGALPAKRIEDWKREYRLPQIDSHQSSA